MVRKWKRKLLDKKIGAEKNIKNLPIGIGFDR